MIEKLADCAGSIAAALGFTVPEMKGSAPVRTAVGRRELERLFPELHASGRQPKEA